MINTVDSVSLLSIVGDTAFLYLCWLTEPQLIPRKGECNIWSIEMDDFEADDHIHLLLPCTGLQLLCCGSTKPVEKRTQ